MFIALLLFFSSSIWGSVSYILLAALLCLKRFETRFYKTQVFRIIILIGLLSVLNYVLTFSFNGGVFLNNYSLPIPYGVTLIFSYIIACSLTNKVLKWLLIFILLDIAIAILEYIFGVGSFWNIKAASFEEESELLYFKRSCGVDPNSSILGINILVGIIILYITRIKYMPILLGYMLLGLFCSFNRSVIIASSPLLLYFCYSLFKKQSKFIKILILSSIVFISIWMYKTYLTTLLEQFFRGSSSFDVGVLSHRDEIWETFMKFFYSHPISGNGSIKMLLPNGWHAHNSFIWVLASNGIIIAILYYLYTFLYINKRNLLPILSILLCSLTQSTIYWGMSVPDILIFYLIINYNKGQYKRNVKNEKIYSQSIIPSFSKDTSINKF